MTALDYVSQSRFSAPDGVLPDDQSNEESSQQEKYAGLIQIWHGTVEEAYAETRDPRGDEVCDEDMPWLCCEAFMLESIHLDNGVGLRNVSGRTFAWKFVLLHTKMSDMEAAPNTQASQFQKPAKKPTTRPHFAPGVTVAQ
jgi:hypothetical protein